jgi:hypothetical protein
MPRTRTSNDKTVWEILQGSILLRVNYGSKKPYMDCVRTDGIHVRVLIRVVLWTEYE